MARFVAPLAIITYIAAGFLTGGHYFNHRCSDSYVCDIDATMAGTFWPVYWSGRGAIEVTK
ncbi:MAG TPA: hypothetical protein VFT58_04905 [Nitrososphaera sp.]|nr:hypothetical protein [Nitrososphaera sp.]